MIKYKEVDRTGIIVLNRPEKRNALNPEMVSAISGKLIELKKNENIKALIITGEGKSFCAGADLEYLNRLRNYSSNENVLDSERLADMFIQIYNFPKPTIAAVNGAAIAGGCGLATVCDFIVAHNSNSKFGYTEVKIGFIPAIVSVFLIKKIGEGDAKKLLLTGEIVDGNEAFKIGLADYLSGDPLNKALELTESLAQNSEYSFKLTKELIHSVSNMNVNDAVDYCIRLNTISRSSEDFKNGINKFLNKK